MATRKRPPEQDWPPELAEYREADWLDRANGDPGLARMLWGQAQYAWFREHGVWPRLAEVLAELGVPE